MFFASTASRNKGAGGRSNVRIRNGVTLEVIVDDSSKRNRSPMVSDFAVMACDSMRNLP